MLRDGLLAITFFSVAVAATGQELSVLGGALQASGQRTYSWEVDYHQRFGEHFALSGGWINEGHLPNHHRDGGTLQLWARTAAFDRRLTLAAGIGPYFYFDTVPAANPDGVQNEHGVGVVASLAATWQLDGPWSLQLRTNYIAAPNLDTTSLLLGVSYRFDNGDGQARDASASGPRALDREVAAMFGRTIVNTLESEDSFAAQIEYRQRLGPNFAWSAGFLNEGDATTQRRSGVLAQLWIGGATLEGRLTGEIGIGPYVVFDTKSNPLLVDSSTERLTGIFSASMSYSPLPQWPVRLTWSRVFASKSHDTDVLVLGAGYRF